MQAVRKLKAAFSLVTVKKMHRTVSKSIRKASIPTRSYLKVFFFKDNFKLVVYARELPRFEAIR